MICAANLFCVGFFKQASIVSELKSWCLSKLQNMEASFTEDPGSTKQHLSTSVFEDPNDADEAGLTKLPAGHEGSLCLELHNSSALLDSCVKPSVTEGGSANHYFVVHVESSPGMTTPTKISVCVQCNHCLHDTDNES